jgi:predicted nucleic acid binding AN1-type Zn finger protein
MELKVSNHSIPIISSYCMSLYSELHMLPQDKFSEYLQFCKEKVFPDAKEFEPFSILFSKVFILLDIIPELLS